MRMVLLKPQDDSDATEKALVGNTILVAQPAPKLIAAQLPPTEAQQASYFNVIYGCGKEKLEEKSSLRVNRAEYLECARLRAERCPLFAAVHISEEVAAAHLPEEGVPNGIERGSIEMATLEHFAPNLSGPATRGQPFRREEEEIDVDDAAAAEEVEEEQDTVTEDAGCCRAPDALIADENANAEFLIGLDGSPDDDAVGKLASFRAKVALAEEAGKRMARATLQVERARQDARDAQQDTYAVMEVVADQAACTAEHRSVCVDLRSVARSMGTEFHDAVERSVTAAYQRKSPATLRIHTGQPLSLFDPASWVACCVEFFFGDCVPNLDRPAKISWRRLFDYLMNREELEYHLVSDTAKYKANVDSRWNKPEFAGLFVDAVRKLEVLQSTKGFYDKHGASFAADLRVLANATDKDFEAFQANLQQAVLQNTSIMGLIRAEKQQGAVAVQKTLHHMLMLTSSAPMTEGNKQAIRHMGQAMNLRFGAFASFFYNQLR